MKKINYIFSLKKKKKILNKYSDKRWNMKLILKII